MVSGTDEPDLDVDASVLARLAEVADALGDRRLRADADALRERVAANRFFVVCVGQFKRGKSSLINALVGQRVLPVGVLPVTSVSTIVRAGPRLAVRVRLASGGWQGTEVEQLGYYVSEARNPGNRARVQAVEVIVPSPLLTNGLCLVDTPGLGSISAASTTATHEFLPQIDAALIVIGADPPLAGEELTLIEQIARQTPHLLVVLNKADRVSETERREAAAFAAETIAQRIGRSVEPIYQLSAEERLAGLPGERDWPALVTALETLASRNGRSLVRSAFTRGVVRLSDSALRQMDDRRAAIERPIEDSTRRLDEIRRCIADVERRSSQLSHLFAADQEALASRVARRRELFLAESGPGTLASFRDQFGQLPAQRAPALRRRAMALARAVASQALSPWLADEEGRAETEYRQLADRFVALANEFLERLAATGELPVDHLPRALPPETGFRLARHFYFHDLQIFVAAAAMQQWWLDRLRTRAAGRRAVQRDAEAHLRQLLEVNTTRVQNDLDERVIESRRHLEAEIQEVLQAVGRSAEVALEHAKATRVAGARAVESELARLDRLRREVMALEPRARTDAISTPRSA